MKDKVIIGVAGGEYGIRGFIAAYDAKTGQGGVALSTRFPGPASRARNLGGRFLEDGRRVRLGDRLL